MKKQLLLTLAAAVSISANAQPLKKENKSVLKPAGTEKTAFLSNSLDTDVAGKTTGLSDTLYYNNNSSKQLFDTSRVYYWDAVLPLDTGYVFGYNVLGINGWAELFNFNYQPDTSFHVLGLISYWSGTVQPNSSKTIDFKIWSQGNQELRTGTTRTYYEGFPAATLKSETVPITTLGIGNPDTIKPYFFAAPLTGVTENFYIGYEANFSWNALAGDTIALRTTRDQYGAGTYYYRMSGQDTILLNRNVMKLPNSQWADLAFDIGLDLNLSLVPIVQFNSANINSVQGITKNNLKFFGNYPNPAGNNTNIKIALNKAADVTVTITDMNGRVVNTVSSRLNEGEQIIPVNTSSLAPGNYIYSVRTSEGDGIASMLSVAK